MREKNYQCPNLTQSELNQNLWEIGPGISSFQILPRKLLVISQVWPPTPKDCGSRVGACMDVRPEAVFEYVCCGKGHVPGQWFHLAAVPAPFSLTFMSIAHSL